VASSSPHAASPSAWSASSAGGLSSAIGSVGIATEVRKGLLRAAITALRSQRAAASAAGKSRVGAGATSERSRADVAGATRAWARLRVGAGAVAARSTWGVAAIGVSVTSHSTQPLGLTPIDHPHHPTAGPDLN